VLAGCNFTHPEGVLTGSVFVVTSGAGSYKFGLVKVYFVEKSEVDGPFKSIAADFAERDQQNFSAALDAEKSYIAASQAQTSMTSRLGDAVKAEALFFPKTETMKREMDKLALDLEEQEHARGNEANLFNASDVVPDKLKTIQDYFAMHLPTPSESKAIDDAAKAVEDLRGDVIHTRSDVAVAKSDLTVATDSLNVALSAYNASKTKLAELHGIEAQECLKLRDTAKFMAETDADGQFQVELPKQGHFVVLAEAHRTIGTQNEDDYWIVPFSLNGRSTGTLTLSNDNELLSPDGGGAEVIDLRSRNPTHEFR
jgi:hypothetical protein